MTDDIIINMYVEQKESLRTIKSKTGYSLSKIRGILLKNRVELRSKSDAQKIALESGRSEHPTEGKLRDKETKKKISESLKNNWDNRPIEEREKFVDKCRERWYNMTATERKELADLAHEGIRRASVEGSKLEKAVHSKLVEANLNPLYHYTCIPTEKLEVDIFLPAQKVAIEIDGPTHFMPIYGEEDLRRNIASDSKKNGILLSYGFVVIRVKHIKKYLSELDLREIPEKIVNIVNSIKEKFPDMSERLIELELN